MCLKKIVSDFFKFDGLNCTGFDPFMNQITETRICFALDKLSESGSVLAVIFSLVTAAQ